jgi:hypothetical protein
MALSRKQLNDLLRRLEGPLRRDFAVAIQSARGRAKITALVRAIELGQDLDSIMLAAGVREGMWSTLTESIRNVYAVSGKARVEGEVPKTFGMEFDINNPRAQEWLTKNSSGLIWGKAVGGGLRPEQRAAVQTMLTNGMLKGNNPRTTALDIVGRIDKTGKRTGGILGLTENQAQWVINMGEDLQDLNWSRYKSRVLRDKRWDKVVKKSMQEGRVLPQAQRNKIVQSYENRMTKYRGDTIARTETLQSLNAASDEALRQVVDEGLAPQNAVTRIWRHSFAGNERPGHLAMSGQPRGIEEPFTNPITGALLQHPGAGEASEVINCRCFVEHKIDFVAVERQGVDPDQFRPPPPPPPPLQPPPFVPIANPTVVAAQAAAAPATPAAAEVTGASQFGGLMPYSTPGPAYNTGRTLKMMRNAQGIRTPEEAAQWARARSRAAKGDREYGAILDKDNRLWDARRGGEGSVTYRGLENFRNELKGGSYFHSHPGSAALSAADVKFAVKFEMQNMTAIGVEFENYFLANGFNTAKVANLDRFADAIERAGNNLWDTIQQNEFRAKIREAIGEVNAKYRQGGHFATYEDYQDAFNAAQAKGDPIYIASSILQNELLARYGGYTFNWALEAGKHSKEIRGWIKKLREAGWVEKMEDANRAELERLKAFWE